MSTAMGTDTDEDLMFTLIRDAMIDDLIAASRIPPTSLYFPDCELCQSLDLPTLDTDRRPESPLHESMGEAHLHGSPPREIMPQFPEGTISPEWFKPEIEPVPLLIKEDPEPPEGHIVVEEKPELVVSDEAKPDTNCIFEYLKPARIRKISVGSACDWCHRVFPSRCTMKRHVQDVHLNLRPYTCEHCPKTFKRKEHLERHRIYHIKEPLVACELCELRSTKHACARVFFHTDVASHRLVCIACRQNVSVDISDKGQPLCERPYKCPCGRCYGRKDSFRKHSRWCRANPVRIGERWSLRSIRPPAERSRGAKANSDAGVFTDILCHSNSSFANQDESIFVVSRKWVSHGMSTSCSITMKPQRAPRTYFSSKMKEGIPPGTESFSCSTTNTHA